MFHYIVQSNVKPCNRFEISHISSPPTTVSHFLHYLVVDQLYTKKVYFCSFVTKSNQATTKYSQYVFSMFYRTITHRGPSHRILTSLPLRQHFPIFHYRTSSFCCLPVSFSIAALQVPSPPNPLSFIYKISIGPDKPPHTLFFCFKKNYFFGDSPISPPCWNTPEGTCSSNRPWYPSFKGIRASTDLFIKNFFFWWSLHFFAFKSPNKNLPKKANAVSLTPSLPPSPKTSQGETSTQSLVTS